MRTVLLLFFALLVPAAAAHAQAYVPPDRPGPPLSVPAEQLAASLRCTGDPAAGDRPPVLLVHGTNLDAEANFGWNWIRALDAEGRPHCEVALLDRGMGDVQTSAEHVVHAIRELHRRARRRIDVVGYSQGGMVPRWALRFWPDTRDMVDDLVGLAASNHGTEDSRYLCFEGRGTCPAAYHQQASTAAFVRALNSAAETFTGIDYTAVYTRYDQVVTPNFDDRGSTALRGGGPSVVNVALQDVCPANTAEHLAIGSYDPVAYAIAMAALDAPGPAAVGRVDRAVCARTVQPGVRPETFARDYGEMLRMIGEASAEAEQVPAEPPLRCYVTASCGDEPPAAGPPLRLTRRCTSGARLEVAVRGGRGVRSVTWRIGGRAVARDARAPFVRRLPPSAVRRSRARKLRAVVRTGRGTVTLARTLPRCGG